MASSTFSLLQNLEGESLEGYRGPSLLTIAGIILVILKLAEVGKVADWSWWIVLLPFIVNLAVGLIVFTIFGVGLLIALFRD